jgi:hypothetical protein
MPSETLPGTSTRTRTHWEIAGQMYPGLGQATRRFFNYHDFSGANSPYHLVSLVVHPTWTPHLPTMFNR